MAAIFPGGWRIAPSNTPNKIWIQSPHGKAGDFCAEEFEKVLTAGEACRDIAGAIQRFFDENY